MQPVCRGHRSCASRGTSPKGRAATQVPVGTTGVGREPKGGAGQPSGCRELGCPEGFRQGGRTHGPHGGGTNTGCWKRLPASFSVVRFPATYRKT